MLTDAQLKENQDWLTQMNRIAQNSITSWVKAEILNVIM